MQVDLLFRDVGIGFDERAIVAETGVVDEHRQRLPVTNVRLDGAEISRVGEVGRQDVDRGAGRAEPLQWTP
jgi:hypothetical protein